MIVLETIAVAFAMFSAVPMPQFDWNEKNMRYALCAFPLVGLVCGLGWGAWAWLCQRLAVPDLLRAGGLCLIPVLITGGIHLDGYADTSDALASYGDQEKKHAILKDPHCGAFAVIRLCTYFTAYYALCGALEWSRTAALSMGLGFLLSRTLAGWAIASLPLAKNTGLAHTFASAAHRDAVRRILLALGVMLMAAMAAAGKLAGGAMAAAALLVLWRYASVAKNTFGGISGDLSGWFIQKCELWMLAALVAVQTLERSLG